MMFEYLAGISHSISYCQLGTDRLAYKLATYLFLNKICSFD
jgi:hypothetical protein